MRPIKMKTLLKASIFIATVMVLLTVFDIARSHKKFFQRSLSSLNVDQKVRAQKMLSFAKANSPIAIELEADQALPLDKDTTFVLTAHIVPGTDISSAAVKWKIPKNIEVVSGHISETLYNLKEQEIVDVTLTVRNLSANNKLIFFDFDTGDGRVAGTNFATAPGQAELETIEMKQNESEFLKAQGFEDKKIFQ